MALRGIANVNQLAVRLKGKVTQPSLYMLMNNPEENNPTLKTLRAIAKVLEVEAWMLIIPKFPFDAMTDKPVGTMSALSYLILQTMEREPDSIKLLITESVSHSLCKIDDRRSHEIKEAQVVYFTKQRDGGSSD